MGEGFGDYRTKEEDKKREDLRDVCVSNRMLILEREGWKSAEVKEGKIESTAEKGDKEGEKDGEMRRRCGER